MDFYEVLGLEFGSNYVKQAYRTLALQYHPDKTVSLSEKERKSREDNLKSIAAVYEVLRDEGEKERYDTFVLNGGLSTDFDRRPIAMSPSPAAASHDEDARDTPNDDFESHECACRNEYTSDNEHTSDDEHAGNDEYTYNNEHTHTNVHPSARNTPATAMRSQKGRGRELVPLRDWTTRHSYLACCRQHRGMTQTATLQR
jgi:DnaJ-class molecular chaperone